MTDDELKALFEGLRRENIAAHEETRRGNSSAVEAAVQMLRHENVAAHEETRRANDARHDETRRANDAKHEETRRHFDVTADRLEKRFDFLAETVQHLSEEQRSMRVELTEKIDRSAAETQAMIKFSHRELDRRISALEESVADLQARVQRIESGSN
jgi:hypothetical protein